MFCPQRKTRAEEMSMKKYGLLALGLSVVFFESCLVAVVDDRNAGELPLSREFHKVLAQEPGGTIDLENWNGDITISGWEKSEVDVTAREVWNQPQKRGIHFYRIGRVRPDIQVDQSEDMIKIWTEQPGEEADNMGLSYDLFVPHSINLKSISNRRGNVRISDLYGTVVLNLDEGEAHLENFSGSLDASVTRGSVEAEILDLRAEDEVKITVREGDITLHLQPRAAARIEATVPNGKLDSEFDLKADQGARLALTALNGNVRVKKAD
jgi:hypothetical protein